MAFHLYFVQCPGFVEQIPGQILVEQICVVATNVVEQNPGQSNKPCHEPDNKP